MNSNVDTILDKAKNWKEELKLLRQYLLYSELTEEIKWYQPCYTYDGSNVVILSGFKEYCALSFFKGVLMNDPDNALIQPTENMQAGRHLRFTSIEEIEDQKDLIKKYLKEAIEVEKKGLKVEFKKTSEFDMPEELEEKLAEDPEFKEAFEALTPGRQRGYILHFSGAKQSKTRIARIERCVPKIFEGKGHNER
jgi:uncharacterized protein YdeI (YjbR/CyaY-like superfamily)